MYICIYIYPHVIGYIKGMAWIFKVSCHQLEEFITKLDKKNQVLSPSVNFNIWSQQKCQRLI